MLHSITAVIANLRRLIERREGLVAIIFALCAIPIFIAAGMAVDIGRAYAVKVRLGAALDAAALAVGSQSNQTAAQLATDLQNYFTANYPANRARRSHRHRVSGAQHRQSERIDRQLSGASHGADDPDADRRHQQHHRHRHRPDLEDHRIGNRGGARQYRLDAVRSKRRRAQLQQFDLCEPGWWPRTRLAPMRATGAASAP